MGACFVTSNDFKWLCLLVQRPAGCCRPASLQLLTEQGGQEGLAVTGGREKLQQEALGAANISNSLKRALPSGTPTAARHP